MKLYIGSYFAFYTSDSNHWIEIELDKPTRLTDIMTELGIPLAEVYLIVVNDKLVDSTNTIVSNNDIIRLYPVIGGG
jgi:sulfur carrier protein ThiS